MIYGYLSEILFLHCDSGWFGGPFAFDCFRLHLGLDHLTEDCFGAGLSMTAVFVYVSTNRTKGETAPVSETNAPNEPAVKTPQVSCLGKAFRIEGVAFCSSLSS